MRWYLGVLCALGLVGGPASAEEIDVYEALLSRDTVGAAAFVKEHPKWDGRGVVVAVLDTGVDMSVSGLETTSTGELKVIETRDFSGEGDVKLARARRTVEDGVAVLRTGDGFVKGIGALPVSPGDGVYWIGFFDEKQLEHGHVGDLNRNGRRDDKFGVVAFRPKGASDPVVFVDTDGDGDLADEMPRKSYRLEPTWFAFTHPSPKKDQTPVAVTVTVFPDEERKVEFHFDDGGHGTHVAGISTGHGIHGREGFDGIAPGAKVISLKIGNNNLSGGATTPGSKKRAIAYASRWAREHQVPVVMNISYGIGSEVEGWSAIDLALTRELEANPLLAASVSAGNSGPGLSTMGMPAASARCWTAGALLIPENAAALWGGKVDRMKVFGFSSRGGELAKPDGLTPGVAWSTVPPFMTRSVMAGTSMAAPQAAGVHALLMSAATDAGIAWTSGSIKRAMKSTAKKLPGYTILDQGAGLVQIAPAWKHLSRVARDKYVGVLLDWDVETAVPRRPGTKGTASFWNTGTYVPGHPHTIDLTVKPVFVGGATDKDKRAFFATLRLRSDARWVRLDRSRVAIRGGTPAHLKLTLNPGAVSKPGLHIAHVTGSATGQHGTAFTVPIVVTMPITFSSAATRSRQFTGSLDPGDIERLFVEVPPGATAMKLHMTTPDKRYGNTTLKLHDPDGRRIRLYQPQASSKHGTDALASITGSQLAPGIWEIVPYATFRNQITSHLELDVSFLGLDVPTDADYVVPEAGGLETALTLTNRFEVPYRATVRASIYGVRRNHTIEAEGAASRVGFSLGPDKSGARLRLSMSAEDYNRFTDVAVNVLDKSGKAIVQSGFSQRLLEIGFQAPPGDYELEFVGATTDPDELLPEEVEWSVQVEETHYLRGEVPLPVDAPDGNPVTFYPGIPVDIALEARASPTEPPEDFHHMAAIYLEDRTDDGPPLRYDLILYPSDE